MRSGQLAKSAKTHKLDEIKHHLSGIRGTWSESQISPSRNLSISKMRFLNSDLVKKLQQLFITGHPPPPLPPKGERRKENNLISTKSKFVNLKVEISQFRLGEKNCKNFINWPSSPSFPPEGGRERKDSQFFKKGDYHKIEHVLANTCRSAHVRGEITISNKWYKKDIRIIRTTDMLSQS